MTDKITPLPIVEETVKYASDSTGIMLTKATNGRPFLMHLTPEEVPQVIEKLTEYSQPWKPAS